MIENNTELWRPVIGYENRYFISNQGRVKGVRQHKKTHPNGYILSSAPSWEYPTVGLYNGTTQKSFLVHRLVAMAFLPLPAGIKKLEVHHKNGIKTDNRISNLEWITHRKNITGRPKLTEFQVAKIRLLLKTQMTQRNIAELFGVSTSIIYQIRKGLNRFKFQHFSK